MSPTTKHTKLCGEVMSAGDHDDPRLASGQAKVRCSKCRALLAARHGDGLLVRRGDVHVWLGGRSYNVNIVCYRCKTLNVVSHEEK
jgi:phage FluMu protein Com